MARRYIGLLAALVLLASGCSTISEVPADPAGSSTTSADTAATVEESGNPAPTSVVTEPLAETSDTPELPTTSTQIETTTQKATAVVMPAAAKPKQTTKSQSPSTTVTHYQPNWPPDGGCIVTTPTTKVTTTTTKYQPHPGTANCSVTNTTVITRPTELLAKSPFHIFHGESLHPQFNQLTIRTRDQLRTYLRDYPREADFLDYLYTIEGQFFDTRQLVIVEGFDPNPGYAVTITKATIQDKVLIADVEQVFTLEPNAAVPDVAVPWIAVFEIPNRYIITKVELKITRKDSDDVRIH